MPVDTYEVIEAYPQDKYLPSCLVHAQYQGETFHIVFATDILGENVHIVAAYRPSLDEWASDGKTRRIP